MNVFEVSFYYFIIGAAMLLTIMGLWFTFIMPCMDRWSRHFFFVYFSVLLLCSFTSLIDFLIAPYSNSKTLLDILSFIESITLSMPAPLLTIYLIHCRKEKILGNRVFNLVLSLWLIYLVMLSSIPFTSCFYLSLPDRQYVRGPWFPLFVMPLILIMLVNLIMTINSHKVLSRRYYIGFLTAIIPLTITLPIHTFIEVTPLIDISIVLSAISMFGLILSDQTQEQLAQQQQIANQRASIMVLQMRPHFIYNTLMSIYSLCNQDPQKARQVTMDFTNYLRKNFNAVASDSTIPFSAELEHTRAYLAVEQAQHDEMLVVDYDTPFINFRLPPLTLQPIVENAVKHGMDPYAGPLHVSIRTLHSDNAVQIIVEDDGSGFDPNDVNETHTTLENIRQRLEIMCKGSMSIESHDKKGTIVTITIPSSHLSSE